MALCGTGRLILKKAMPTFVNPVVFLPSSVSMQTRHAARKGYREKVKKQKSLDKSNAAANKEEAKLIKKFTKITKTVDLKKPEPPKDDVIVANQFNYCKYSLPEIIEFHREYHHPTVYNNPFAPISLKIEIRMIGKKEVKGKVYQWKWTGGLILMGFYLSGVAPIPHPFNLGLKKEVLVFCKPEDTDLAFKCGASMAGGLDVIKKVKEGSIQPALFEYIIAHTNIFPELSPIRNILKLQLPKAKQGTLTNDLKYAINKFLHGVEYSCVKVGDSQDFGIIDLDVGTLDMETSHIEDNFKAIIQDIEQHRPKKEGKFITWIWCLSRPSSEQFSVDLSQYIESEAKAETPAEAVMTEGEAAPDDDEDEDDAGEAKAMARGSP